jgi:hypothetical protein
MASFAYHKAIQEIIFQGTVVPGTNTLKIMLVNSTYTPNKDNLVVDAGGANDPADAEIVATNYARLWGGAGRKTVTVTSADDTTNDRAVLIFADLTWSALGGATNDTIVGAILIKEGGANDTTSRLIAYFDVTDATTNGSDYTLDFDNVNGNIRFTV